MPACSSRSCANAAAGSGLRPCKGRPLEGITESGYRLIINNGPDANQVIFHLHLHILGGHYMRHPMG